MMGIVGETPSITLRDEAEVPFVEPSVTETTRAVYPAGPIGIRHKATEDTSLRGYVTERISHF